MDIEAARTVAASEIIIESAAICITSGSRVKIRFNACKNPDIISPTLFPRNVLLFVQWFRIQFYTVNVLPLIISFTLF